MLTVRPEAKQGHFLPPECLVIQKEETNPQAFFLTHSEVSQLPYQQLKRLTIFHSDSIIQEVKHQLNWLLMRSEFEQGSLDREIKLFLLSENVADDLLEKLKIPIIQFVHQVISGFISEPNLLEVNDQLFAGDAFFEGFMNI